MEQLNGSDYGICRCFSSSENFDKYAVDVQQTENSERVAC